MVKNYNLAICVLAPNKNNVKGIIKFKTFSNKVKVMYEIYGLKDGEHGFHVHECGDLTDGCSSACAHFNPGNTVHGGRKSKVRHVGDLGNIKSKNGVSKGFFYDNIISLDYKHKNCILGRAVVVHKDVDDLGKGGDQESLITGNAGKRVACGVIGITHKFNV
jgi:superoxide dismutase, Cu-Zn family